MNRRKRSFLSRQNRVNAPRAVADQLGSVLEALSRMARQPCDNADLPRNPVQNRQDATDPRHLVELWRNWAMVMGPALAPLALPLGCRGEILVVGGEDNLVLQELSFQTPELLERVNAFMDAPPDAPVFTRVELRLIQGKRPLSLPPETPVRERHLCRPADLGAYLDLMDPESPVARCYAACLRMHGLCPDSG